MYKITAKRQGQQMHVKNATGGRMETSNGGTELRISLSW